MNWSFLSGRLCLLCICLGLSAISCSPPRVTCPVTCQLGNKRCSTDKASVETCKKIFSTGCLQWTPETCPSGRQCKDSTTLASCEPIDTCPTPCKSGSTGCEGAVSVICQPNPTTQCNEWKALRACNANEICDFLSGQCTPNTCQPKNPQTKKQCIGNSIYWFDDCGKQGPLLEQCSPPKTCKEGACLAQGCTPKNPQAQQKCVGNAVYWFDDCGKQGQLVAQCTAAQSCSNGKCTTTTGCQAQHECASGTSRCQSNAVQVCDSPANECRRWGTPAPCSTGMKCENGTCIVDNSSNGTTGAPCSSGSQCQGSVCLQWPAGYCTTRCTGSCASGSICAGLRSTQGTLYVCLKQCRTDTDCRSGYTCYQGRACLYTGSSSGCKSDNDCPAGQRCDSSNGSCVQTGCLQNSDCTSPQICQNKTCVTPPCKQNSDCPSGQTCQNGTCKGSGTPGTPGSATTRQISVGGTSRSYILYPGKNTNNSTPSPVLLAFHGLGDSASNYINTSQWKNLADQYNFILAAMDKPAGGGQKSGFWDAYNSTSTDISYADAVLQDIQNSHNTNPKRLYVVGFSQGGYFAFRYGLERASTLAAFAVQAASNPGRTPTPTRKIPVVFVIGTLDSAYARAKQDSTNLQNAGHTVKWIELPGQGHCCAAQSSKNNDVWLFFQNHTLP